MSRLPPWSARDLAPTAVGVSASRRTDIPALYGAWLAGRLEAGRVEYVPAGPPRRIERSLRPEDVTHFTFWSKWPRPFFPTLGRLLEAGYPVLWNVTITGLGGTAVEPSVPPPERAVAAVGELSRLVGPGAIVWRYDPVFVSERFGPAHHERTFAALAGALAGRVDRVAISFVEPYARRVAPDLRRYGRETGDAPGEPSDGERLALAARLGELAAEAGVPLTVCCEPELGAALGCEPTGCNRFAWACRVYPDLARHRALRDRPTRAGCACSREVDIGVYDTCTLGCRYCYATRDRDAARRARGRHDPAGACLAP